MLSAVVFWVSLQSSLLQARQPVADSLVQWLQEDQLFDTTRVQNLTTIAQWIYRGYPDSARIYLRQALTLSEELGYTEGKAAASRIISNAFHIQDQLDSTIYYTLQAKQLYEELGDVRGIAVMNSSIGVNHARAGQYDLAITSFLEAVDNFEKFGNYAAVGTTLNNIGSLYLEQELFEQALSYYSRAEDVLNTPDFERYMGSTLTNSSLVHFELGNYETAMEYINRGIMLATNYELIRNFVGLYGTKGEILELWGEYEEALINYNLSMQYAEEIGSEVDIAENKFFIGSLIAKQGKPNEAKGYLLDAVEFMRTAPQLTSVKSGILLAMVGVEKDLGNFEEALNYSLELNAYADSLHGEEMALRISELETIYETEKKEAQIKFLEVENELARTRAAIIGIIGAFLILAVAIGSLWYYRKKTAEKRIKMEAIKKELQQFSLLLAEKNSFISTFRDELEEVRKHVSSFKGRKEITHLVDTIHMNSSISEQEEILFTKVEKVNQGFFVGLRGLSTEITSKDERLATLVQMDMSNKDIANILHIEPNSVKQAKRRLKKKLNVSTEMRLKDYLDTIAVN